MKLPVTSYQLPEGHFRNPKPGMTLLEVLVAFIVFLFLVTALVSLATSGLETWTMGEERKDVYDRAQRVLGQFAEDLRATLADTEWHVDGGGRPLQHAYFVCDTDKNRAQRLRFVRAASLHRVNADPGIRVKHPAPDLDYTQAWEVAYVMDSDPLKPVLLRGLRCFDRRTQESLLNASDMANTSSAFGKQCFRSLDSGVLWLYFRFWTRYTTTWALPGEDVWVCGDRGHSGVMTSEVAGKCPACGREMTPAKGGKLQRSSDPKDLVGPSLLWDSSRSLSEGELGRFIHHRSRLNRDDPDFCIPEIVRVVIVMESQASVIRMVTLSEAVGEGETSLRVNSTRGLPDAPNFIRVGTEWIEYSAKGTHELTVRRRGARGTTAQGHAARDRVRFGETFTTDVHVSAYREPVR